ncbi:SRPBCC family protein [Chitinophaga qingshengii]|uniref:SRPBCC domain-containing protein n=1 Tax=Chitinophaga qingshengii TaxID=1569794 RepID=A0ABR7TRR6_9BACT|nr:SRPBCC domain-containing protein [Chitinophaga qingshengii]MBC9933186.1 SRPBCC domain-containing protein [Chitinophaga qingshengii]
MSDAIFRAEYRFKALRTLVFEAFSDAAALNQWWGPVETRNSVVSLDFRPGGIFHFRMEGNGTVSYGRFLFRDIQPPHLLEFTNAFADENAQVVKAPFDMPFPLEILYRIILQEEDGETLLSITGRPVNAGPEETAAFLSINGSMHEGFGATFHQLDLYLHQTNNI